MPPSPYPNPPSGGEGLLLGGKLNYNVSSPILGGKTAFLQTCHQYWYYNAVPLYSGSGSHDGKGSSILYADGAARFFKYEFQKNLSIPIKPYQPQTQMLDR